MQRWEYLEVIRTSLWAKMLDSNGRQWESNEVTATVGVEKGWRGEKAIDWSWRSATGLSELGAEGWELVGVLPDEARITVKDSNQGDRGTVLIFKRPKE